MKPEIRKLGAIDMVETTPVVYRGKLYRFEYVRPNYWDNSSGRFVLSLCRSRHWQLTRHLHEDITWEMSWLKVRCST